MAVRIRRPSPRRLTRASLSVVGVALAVALSACGGGDEGEAQDPREDGEGTTTSAGETGSTAPSGRSPAEPECADGESAGRRYVLCTAGQAPDQPLIVALHGRGSSADEMRATTALEVPAAASGMAVVFPESLDGRWGDDTVTTPTRPAGDEDMAFLDSLVDDLRSDPRIDDRPVAVVGFSNGGSMAMRYAAARPDQTVAVVAVAGQLPRDPAVRPTGRVPLLAVYGTADPVRPYATGIADDPQRTEGAPTPTLPTSESVAAFVDAAGGAPAHEGPTPSDPAPDDETSLSTERWSDDDGTVAVLVSVVGGGHTWPSALTPPPGGFGPVSGDLDASEAAVRFVAEAG
jgi:polyhydroxybutyrate depolymerase